MSDHGVVRKFLGIWKGLDKPLRENLFNTVISPRNVALLNNSTRADASWDLLSDFIIALLREELLSCDTLETQCLSIYKHNWEQVSRSNFTNRVFFTVMF